MSTEIYYPLSTPTLTKNDHNYFTDTFREGIFNIKTAFSSVHKVSNVSDESMKIQRETNELSLIDRISHFALGLVLCIPLINIIAFNILIDVADIDDQLQDLMLSNACGNNIDLTTIDVLQINTTNTVKQFERIPLETIELTGLTQIPDMLSHCSQLKKLKFVNMQVDRFPDYFQHLTTLEKIKFVDNEEQTCIPEGTDQIPNLKKITIPMWRPETNPPRILPTTKVEYYIGIDKHEYSTT